MILSLQLSARSSITGEDGRALNAQSIWRTWFKQMVKLDSGIGDESRRYKDMLQYTSFKVDFNVGEGVYMMPINMFLLMGNRRDFNNKILVSEHDFKIGVNKLVNSLKDAFKTVPKEAFKTAFKTVPKQGNGGVSKRQRLLG